MAFNDHTEMAECPRCGNHTLDTRPGYNAKSLKDSRIDVCDICGDEEQLLADPWPGYPGPINRTETRSMGVDDLTERTGIRAGVHGILNAPDPDLPGTRQSRISTYIPPVGHYAITTHPTGHTEALAATDHVFRELQASIDEGRTP